MLRLERKGGIPSTPGGYRCPPAAFKMPGDCGHLRSLHLCSCSLVSLRFLSSWLHRCKRHSRWSEELGCASEWIGVGNSFVHSFIRSVIHSFVHTFLYLLIHSLVHPSIHSSPLFESPHHKGPEPSCCPGSHFSAATGIFARN